MGFPAESEILEDEKDNVSIPNRDLWVSPRIDRQIAHLAIGFNP